MNFDFMWSITNHSDVMYVPASLYTCFHILANSEVQILDYRITSNGDCNP